MNFTGSRVGRARGYALGVAVVSLVVFCLGSWLIVRMGFAYQNDAPRMELIPLAIVGASGLVSGAFCWSTIARDRQLSIARGLGVAAATACMTFVLVSLVFVAWAGVLAGSFVLVFYALLFVVIVSAIPYGAPLALLMIGWTFVWRRLVNAATARI